MSGADGTGGDGVIEYFNEDCMVGMKRYPDKYFELAIVDPPYFEGAGDPAYYRSRTCQSTAKPITETWTVPGEDYFKELFRVSKKQIIWGCNFQTDILGMFLCVGSIIGITYEGLSWLGKLFYN